MENKNVKMKFVKKALVSILICVFVFNVCSIVDKLPIEGDMVFTAFSIYGNEDKKIEKINEVVEQDINNTEYLISMQSRYEALKKTAIQNGVNAEYADGMILDYLQKANTVNTILLIHDSITATIFGIVSGIAIATFVQLITKEGRTKMGKAIYYLIILIVTIALIGIGRSCLTGESVIAEIITLIKFHWIKLLICYTLAFALLLIINYLVQKFKAEKLNKALKKNK